MELLAGEGGGGMLVLVDGDVVAVSDGEAPAGFVGAGGGGGDEGGGGSKKGGKGSKKKDRGGEGAAASEGKEGGVDGSAEGEEGGGRDGGGGRGGDREEADGPAAIARLRRAIKRQCGAAQGSSRRSNETNAAEESTWLERSRAEHMGLPRWVGVQEHRGQLPARARREELLGMLERHQVVVVTGETGCGKTTQLPQFVLEDAIARGVGGACNIICECAGCGMREGRNKGGGGGEGWRERQKERGREGGRDQKRLNHVSPVSI